MRLWRAVTKKSRTRSRIYHTSITAKVFSSQSKLMEPILNANPLFDRSRGNTHAEQFTNDTAALRANPMFLHSMTKIPLVDVDAIRAMEPKMPLPNILFMLARLRWSNPCCNYCEEKSNPAALWPCGQCCFVFYCSKECQRNDKEKHSLRCCVVHGPADDGPLGTIGIRAIVPKK